MGKRETARDAMRRTSAREGVFLAELLAGRTVAEASKAAGFSRATGFRIRECEDFQKQFRAAKEELLSAAVARLHTNAALFVETLGAVCSDPTARGSEKASAAREGLAALSRLVEQFDLAERLGKLEEQVREKQR